MEDDGIELPCNYFDEIPSERNTATAARMKSVDKSEITSSGFDSGQNKGSCG